MSFLVCLFLFLTVSCATKSTFDASLYPKSEYYIGVGVSEDERVGNAAKEAKSQAFLNLIDGIDGLRQVSFSNKTQMVDNGKESTDTFQEETFLSKEIEIDTGNILYFEDSLRKGIMVHAVLDKKVWAAFSLKRIAQEKAEALKLLVGYDDADTARKLEMASTTIRRLEETVWGPLVEIPGKGNLLNSLRSQWSMLQESVNEGNEYLESRATGDSYDASKEKAYLSLIDLGVSYAKHHHEVSSSVQFVSDIGDAKLKDYITTIYQINSDDISTYEDYQSNANGIVMLFPKVLLDERMEALEKGFRRKADTIVDYLKRENLRYREAKEKIEEGRRLVDSNLFGPYYLMDDEESFDSFFKKKEAATKDPLSLLVSKDEKMFLGKPYLFTIDLQDTSGYLMEGCRLCYLLEDGQGREIAKDSIRLGEGSRYQITIIPDLTFLKTKMDVLHLRFFLQWGNDEKEITPVLSNTIDFLVPAVKSGNVDRKNHFLSSDEISCDLAIGGIKKEESYRFVTYLLDEKTGKTRQLFEDELKGEDDTYHFDHKLDDEDADGEYLLCVVWDEYPSYRLYERHITISTSFLKKRNCSLNP